MSDSLTAEFIKSTRVVFRPQTPEEAVAIQQWMFRHGIAWKEGKMEVGHIGECVSKGMVVDGGHLLHSPSSSPAFIANLRDLDGINPDDFLTPEQKMDRRIGALETSVGDLHAKVDRLLALLEPQVTLKPQTLRKGGGAAP